MAENSNISWTDNTMNWWLGCTEASVEGCATCYAREQDKRYQWGVPREQAAANRDAGIAPHWGNVPRHRTAPSNWAKPDKWNAKAATAEVPTKVFSSSLSDFFDNGVPPEWRQEAWAIIKRTTHLRWQILTKRVPNINGMLPPDWGDGYPNVGLVASCVTQAEYDRDRPRLLGVPARWHGFSFEPQVGPIDIHVPRLCGTGPIWFITGGDSAQPTSGLAPRLYNARWASAIVSACRAGQDLGLRLYPFVKQLGAEPRNAPPQTDPYAGENMDDWPADIRVREFPPEILS